MTNFFSGIYRANDALTAARYGLEVTGNNIANANTPGYTRQRAEQASAGPAVGVPTIHSGFGEDGGVRATGTARLGDMVLDTRTRAEHARTAAVDTQAARLADVENIFREPSDTGLSEQLHDFWNAWGDVANDPGGQVPREMLIAAAESTVTMMQSMDSALNDVATAAQNSLDAAVTSANTDAESLAELNRKIAIGHATGANINSLLDQRDLLLDNLSKTVGGVAAIHTNGTATVTVGGPSGFEIVSVGPAQNGAAGFGGPPFAFTPISVSTTENSPTDVTVDVTVGGSPVTLTDSTAAGEAKTLTDTVPRYRALLDDVAQRLVTTVNDLQGDGYDLVHTDGTGGTAMFTGTTAATIDVADGFGWKNVAASSTDPSSDGAVNLDAGNALAAALMGSDPDGPDTSYSSLIGDLGRAAASAKQQQTTQNVITASVDVLKSTASGVSFDEEVSNLLTYQMAFQASSRVLTTLDSMLDTLINRTGLVGR